MNVIIDTDPGIDDALPEKCVKNTFLGDNIVGKGYLKLKKS